MPVRSLSSSVLRWPDRTQVDEAVRHWAADLRRSRPDILRIGYFGSYARGNWGVGSDLDLLVVVEESTDRPERRAMAFDASRLPVPVDLFVVTRREWETLTSGAVAAARRDGVWVFSDETSR